VIGPPEDSGAPAGEFGNRAQTAKDAVAILLSRANPRSPETRDSSRWIASDKKASAPDSLY
jgi:hypothetical protein